LSIVIDRIDHVVLTVADVERTLAFYARVLGMKPVAFGAGARALHFGNQKFNVHPVGRDDTVVARNPTPGAVDVCLVTRTPVAEVVAHLKAEGVPIEEGPVPRTGAVGPITSVYFRDPDGNLVEVSAYD
jgi:catechol 2,3-dioxygenase-like lactoylglutathione lyase family enzyme